MKSKKSSRLLDLDRAFPTSAEDIVALRRAGIDGMQDLKTYLEFLSNFPPPSIEELRARKGPAGPKPFELQ
jgi:hypothetical protein